MYACRACDGHCPYGELLLLIAIHLKEKQLDQIEELIAETLNMKVSVSVKISPTKLNPSTGSRVLHVLVSVVYVWFSFNEITTTNIILPVYIQHYKNLNDL